MIYAGLTHEDKPALKAAKQDGCEWIARDDISEDLCGFDVKPFKNTKYGRWYARKLKHIEHLDREDLRFIWWSDTEPVNVDLALAQIAEMESAQKLVQEYLASDVKSKAPMTNRDKWMQLWNESDEILARQFVEQEWFGIKWCVYMFSEEPISRHDKWEDAIQAAITALHSPYTEGANK